MHEPVRAMFTRFYSAKYLVSTLDSGLWQIVAENLCGSVENNQVLGRISGIKFDFNRNTSDFYLKDYS